MSTTSWIKPVLSAALLLTLASAAVCEETRAQQGDLRWRTSTSEGRSSLVQASSDATDAVGRFAFTCVVKSGNVAVSVAMTDEQRFAFAALLTSGEYPTVTLSDVRTKSALAKLEFGDADGWSYAFTVPVDSKWFDDFEKTGSLRLTIGKTITDGDSLNVGLGAINDFRSQCRKTHPAPPLSFQSLPRTHPNPDVFPPAKLISPEAR
ncbi:hypothetical protein KQX63_09045 [Rhodopseudomonas palustris]|uniref:hypothetical protein n=1 Tax=Rhodopseudomonas palustris TaxID=1076 RepID=UPI0021F364F6|nr:hypothetical protein [Rhodopseudomonas palustris]UYO46135.1 hypothetical protein KQX63_09045 [Rhodopseudomonas palustris]